MKTEESASSTGLRRELKIWGALALSIGLMSPALAMSASGAGAAGIVGRAVPLAFLFAGVAVCLVAFGFIYLSRYYSHAGSVYGFTGITLGPRAGFFSGWALLGCYAMATPGSLIAFGGFLKLFLAGTGVWPHANYITLTLIGGALVWLFTAGEIKTLARSLLVIECTSVAVIVVLMVVVVVHLAGHSGPGHLGLTPSVFVPPPGLGFHAVALAAVFGFLAFEGFEAAASVGEETQNPRKSIPRALTISVLGAGVFFVLCMTVQSLAFGATASGASQFAKSAGPLFQIASSYLASGVGHVLELGAACSAFGSALGSAAGASRLLFAITRDAAPSNPLARIWGRTGAPAKALAVLMVFSFGVNIVEQILGTAPLTAWGYVGTIGVLAIIVAYLMVNVGALKHMYRNHEQVPRWHLVLPVAAIVALAYVLYSQVYPVPASPFNIFPYVVAAWLAIPLVVVLVAPGLAKRIGRGLAREEGLVISETSEVAEATPQA